MRNFKASRGFSLIELMIVVVVIAILATLVYPSYVDYVRRGRIADATSELASRKVRMEQYFQDNRTYVGAPACTEAPATQSVADAYVFSCNPAATATTYTLEAAGQGAMAGFTYSISETGTRATTISGVSTSWDATSATCWITKKNGVC